MREFSAGGVVLRWQQGKWWVAAIEPQREIPADKKPQSRRKVASVLALPKGLVDEGEKPEQTALREVREETGVEAGLVSKLKEGKGHPKVAGTDDEIKAAVNQALSTK